MNKNKKDEKWRSIRGISGGGKLGITHVYRDKTKKEVSQDRRFTKTFLIALLIFFLLAVVLPIVLKLLI